MAKFYYPKSYKIARQTASANLLENWSDDAVQPITHDTWQQGLASELEKDMTPAERKLWKPLKRVENFQPQVVINNFICDFEDLNLKIVIELDGSVHQTLEIIKRDKIKTAVLEKEGYKILRFSNNLILKDVSFVLKTIRSTIKARK